MQHLGAFFQNHLGEIYVISGFSLILLGIAILFQPRENNILPFAPSFHWLAWFGLLHGGREIFKWWVNVYEIDLAAVPWIDALLLFPAFIPLFRFSCDLWQSLADGENNINYWRALICNQWLLAVPLLLVVASAWIARDPTHGINDGASLFLCFPSALMAGLGLQWYEQRNHKYLIGLRLDRALSVCAVALTFYGILSGLIGASDLNYPHFIPTKEDFLELTGFPVEFFRVLCSVLLAASAGIMLHRVNAEYRRRECEASATLAIVSAELDKRVQQRTTELQLANRALLKEISERGALMDKLRSSKKDLEHAQHVGRIGSWYLDIRSGELYWSSEAYNIFQIEEGTRMSYEAFLSTVHPVDLERVDHAWKQALKGADYDIVHRILAEDVVRWVREKAEFEYDMQGELQCAIGTVQDITDLKSIELALQESNEKLRLSEFLERQSRLQAETEHSRMIALLSAMNVGILFEDRDGKIEYINNAFRHLWAIDNDFDPVGKLTSDVFDHSTNRFARPDHASKFVLQVVDTHEISERSEIELIDGRILTQISYPVTDHEGQIFGRLWLYEDITHERQTSQQLLYLAEHDALTGLFNRHRFQEQLEHSILISQRSNGRFALIYFDLDEFKYVNDTFGHRSGDTVLVRVGSEVSLIVRGIEIFARLGGDEFAIIYYLSEDTDVAALPVRINQTVSTIPFRFRGTNFRVTASIGVSIFPDHGESAEELVAHADSAMYIAKSQGKNTWALYDPHRNISEAMAERINWRQRIQQALEEDLFELHFQGIFYVQQRRLSHMEVLVRMRDPQNPGQLIMPNQFIPLAEKTGQILEVDRWILCHSIRLLSENPRMPALAINISGRSFDNPGLPKFISDCLSEYQVDSRRLIIELTETEAVSDIQDAQHFIESIRKAGCRVCLDDFGSGFSTFAYLKYLDADILKIDGMFIRDLPNNHDNQVFVQAMVGIAGGLGKTILAECVEDVATLEMIADLKIDLVQGYHLHRPAADYSNFLK